MAYTHFSGVDTTLLKVNGTQITATPTELNKVAGVTAGTVTASKAVVVDANKRIDTLVIADGGLFLGTGAGTAVGATAAEINARCDDSAMVETLTGAGAISVTVAETRLVTTGANALTIAAPTKPGMVKVITMKTDGGDGTLASTNIVGQSAGSTSITFNDANDALVLIANVDAGKWIVLKEVGVSAA
jgi:hypothetical protein